MPMSQEAKERTCEALAGKTIKSVTWEGFSWLAYGMPPFKVFNPNVVVVFDGDVKVSSGQWNSLLATGFRIVVTGTLTVGDDPKPFDRGEG
jgi:hypothetical protein